MNISTIMTGDTTQTEFNGALAYIYRLDGIMKNLNQVTAMRSSEAGHMLQLLRTNYNLLNDLFKELYPKMKEDKSNMAKDHLDASERLKEYLEFAQVQFERNGTISPEIEKIFDRWEIELRHFAEKKGLLAPDKSGAGEAAYG